MKLLVATDAFLYRTPDGHSYCNALYGYGYFCRFLSVFEQVRVAARQREAQSVPADWLRVDGPGVEVFGLPFYRGPRQLISKYFSTHWRLRRASEGCAAAMLRAPGQTGHMTFSHVYRRMPVGVEVVSDFSGFVHNKKESMILRLLYAIMSAKLARVCRSANGVTYVTREAIQKHYPSYAMLHGASAQYFDQYCSDIALDDADFCTPRAYAGQRRFTLILTDAAMNAERKGERLLLRVIRRLRDMGYDVRAVFVGDGLLRASFEADAASLGLSEAVTFPGLLSSHAQVMEALKAADIYVLPSQAEGLSRGIVEAMAAGLPCLSTPVGGTPELLGADCLLAPDDEDGFVRVLSEWMAHPETLERLSRENLAQAQAFRGAALEEKRKAFYGKLRALAEREGGKA